MRRALACTASTLATLLVVGLSSAAGTPGCALPTATSDEPVATSCNLELIGAVELSPDGGTGRIAVHGDLAAVVQRDDGQVALVDLADPSAPTVLGRYDGGTGVEALDHPLDGDVAFSDDGTLLFHARQTSDYSNEGLHVLDVSDPSSPTLVGLHLQGGMLRLGYARLGDLEVVVTLDAIGGMTILRIDRTPGGVSAIPIHVDPLPATKVGGPASAGVHLDADDPITGAPLLYVTDGTTGLRILDLTDPAQPVTLGTWDVQGLADIAVHATGDGRTVHAASEYWFDAATPPELITLDATDLGAVTEVGRVNLGDYGGEVAWKLGGLSLADDLLHVAHGHAGLVTTTAAAPGAAITAASTDLGEPSPSVTYRRLAWYAMDVHAHGEWVLVTDAVTGELRVFAPRP